MLTNSPLQAIRHCGLLCCSLFPCHSAIADSSFESPSGATSVALELRDEIPHWSASYHDQLLFDASPIEVFLGGEPVRFEEAIHEDAIVRTSFELTWGQFKTVQDHYREVQWKLIRVDGGSVKLTLRVYDDAFAFQICVPDANGPIADRFGLRFAGDYSFWAANGERPNHGPLALSAWEPDKPLQAPMTVKVDDSTYLAVLEAGIYQQYPFHLRRVKGTRFETRNKPCDLGDAGTTSWRVISLGQSPGALITNQILYKLNPPCSIEDTSWIKPGFTLWDWRAWGATADDGFQYGLDMASWRRFIDFAAKKENVRYLMLDANWYGPEFTPESDPTTSRDHVVKQLPSGEVVREDAPDDWEPIDVPGIIDYATQRDVGIILYLNDKARQRYDFDETLATYERWGAAGIKYGFMATRGNKKVAETRYIVRKCADHKLICDFHDGPIPGSGDERTCPNYLTREFCHAQSDAKRSFSPTHFCTTVFVNMLTGSLDMANGLYAIEGAAEKRPRIFQKVETTVVGETARTLINFGALSILPDIPEAYQAKSDLFEFIETMPLTWDETRVLQGEIGEVVCIARRSGASWWIGTAGNEQQRELKLKLSFLEPDRNYAATLYADAENTHYQTNPEAYCVESRPARQGDVIDVRLAPGGGHCVQLRPE